MITNEKMKSSPLAAPVHIGNAEDGAPVYKDLREIGHLLVGGSGGTGKTAFLKRAVKEFLDMGITVEIVDFTGKDEYDEFSEKCYVAKNCHQAVPVLRFFRMMLRVKLHNMKVSGARDIEEYNMGAERKRRPDVLIVDGAAELFVSEKCVECISEVAELGGRRTGVYMIIASQHATVMDAPDKIKENIPSRLTFRLDTPEDSRILLGECGAENLGLGEVMCVNFDKIEKGAVRLKA